MSRMKCLPTKNFSHNDIHPGNMMVGVGPYVAESHILIDFDNSAWGYRGFDFNYFFVQVRTNLYFALRNFRRLNSTNVGKMIVNYF